MKLKIKKDDTVQVISGADKGKSGKVLEIDREGMRVTVEGVNVRKRHVKPSQKNPQGGILEKPLSIHYSNVKLMAAKATETKAKTSRSEGKKARATG